MIDTEETPVPTTPETPPTNVVDVSDLIVRYGKMTAVDNLSFSIPKGEVFGFIGPNGAGKTSTFKVLSTLLKPDSGTAIVDGINVATHPEEVRRIIGFAPDYFGVYEDLTAREYLHFFAAAYRLDPKRRRSVVDDVLALTDLTEKVDSPVDGLSRGMKQRLGLARVLLHDPKLLILDEPASGLDPRARIEMRELLKELQNMGKTIVVSSHILHELSQFCTHIGILEAGKWVVQGSLNDIYKALSVQRKIHIQLVDPPASLIPELEKLPAVAKLEESSDRIEVSLHEDQMAIEDLHAEVVRLGGRVRMFQAEAMDMETAFMKLTEGKTA